MHGPLLPKNPKLADKIIKNAVLRRYPDNLDFSLCEIDDTIENEAHNYITDRFVK